MDFLPPSRCLCRRMCTIHKGLDGFGGGGGEEGSLDRVDIQLEILSSTVFILFFFIFFLCILSFLPSLCYVSRLVLDRLDRRAPRLENPKRKCFRFVREVGIILSRINWLAFIPRNFFLCSCKLFPMKIRFISGGRFLFRVIIPSGYLRLSYASVGNSTIVSIWSTRMTILVRFKNLI